MTPEIKAAIEKMAEIHADKGFERNVMDAWELMEHDFKAGAEYGYKLGVLVGAKEALEDTVYDEKWEMYNQRLKELLNEK